MYAIYKLLFFIENTKDHFGNAIAAIVERIAEFADTAYTTKSKFPQAIDGTGCHRSKVESWLNDCFCKDLITNHPEGHIYTCICLPTGHKEHFI